MLIEGTRHVLYLDHLYHFVLILVAQLLFFKENGFRFFVIKEYTSKTKFSLLKSSLLIAT